MSYVQDQIAAYLAGLIDGVNLKATCSIHDERLVVLDPPRCAKCLKADGITGAHTIERTAEQMRRMKPNYRRDSSLPDSSGANNTTEGTLWGR